MRRRNITGLIVLNAVLLLVLGVLCLTPQPAAGQLGARGGNYTMIAGRVSGQTTSSVYIVELNSGRMIAVQYDDSRKLINVQGTRDIAADLK